MQSMRLIALLSLLLLASCVSNPAYPPDWPEFSVDRYEDCPKISGMYSDVAYAHTPQWTRDPQQNQRLNRLSLHVPLQYIDKTRTLVKPKVKITQSPGGDLEFSLLEDETIVTKKTYSRQGGDFHCDGTELLFSDWSGMGKAGLGIGSMETVFSMGVDGSLIVKTQSRGAGLGLLIFPIVVLKDRQWYRYMQAD